MKAVIYETYGSPDVLVFEEVKKPAPLDNEILIKIRAASVNPRDWHLMRADPWLVRLMTGLLKPRASMLGSDIAGQVETVGTNVAQFQFGDDVFGDIGDHRTNGFAEYVSVPERALALKPVSLTFEEAAAVPGAALAALQGLRDHGQIQAGDKVLINGASGGVGTFAVQIAKSFDAEVTGVCSTKNLELVRSLGADYVIDYTQEDFSENGLRYDLILDNVGNPAHYKRFYKYSLTPEGICVIAAGSFFLQLFLGPWMSLSGPNKILTYATKPNQKDLLTIKSLLEDGRLVPVIDRRYPLNQTADAIRYLENRHARGKVIITM
jgi:NADPH:quinone reductase-like Zn-dependent oxidoreductase